MTIESPEDLWVIVSVLYVVGVVVRWMNIPGNLTGDPGLVFVIVVLWPLEAALIIVSFLGTLPMTFRIWLKYIR